MVSVLFLTVFQIFKTRDHIVSVVQCPPSTLSSCWVRGIVNTLPPYSTTIKGIQSISPHHCPPLTQQQVTCPKLTPHPSRSPDRSQSSSTKLNNILLSRNDWEIIWCCYKPHNRIHVYQVGDTKSRGHYEYDHGTVHKRSKISCRIVSPTINQTIKTRKFFN